MNFFDKYKVYLLAIACAYTLTALTTGIAATFRPTDLINQHQYISIQSTNTSVSNSSVPLVCTKGLEGYERQICNSHDIHQWYLPNKEKGIASYMIFLAVILLAIIIIGWIRAGFGSFADHVAWSHYGIYIIWIVTVVIIHSFLQMVHASYNQDTITCTAVFFIFFSEFWNITNDSMVDLRIQQSVSRALMIILLIFVQLVVLVAYAWALSASVQFHHTIEDSWRAFGWSWTFLAVTIPILISMNHYDNHLPTAQAIPLPTKRQHRFTTHQHIDLKF